MNNEEYIVAQSVQNEGESVAPVKQKPAYKMKWATAFAWIVALLAFFFCRTQPISQKPFLALLFVFALYISGVSWTIAVRGKQSFMSLMFGVSGLVFSLSLFITDNEVLHSCSFLWVICSYIYWLYLSCGNTIDKSGGLLVLDFIKAFLVMPFTSLSSFFDVCFGIPRGENRAERNSKIWRNIGWIALGLLIAIIPTVVVTVLLTYDDSFSQLLSRLFDIPLDKIASYFRSVAFSVPLAIFGFSMLVSFSTKRMSDSMTEAGCRKFILGIKFAPKLMVLFAVIPLLVVYILFFVSQGEYYLAAFSGKLPESITYASYARRGFFELCTVSGINAFVLILISLFMRHNTDGKSSAVQRIVSILLSLSTLVLIATAISKMVMYIDIYGLTQLRVYTTWFMILLSVGFVCVIIKQLVPKFRGIIAFVVAFIVLYSGLALTNVDAVIVKSNADRYISGELDSFDARSMQRELGASATPELVRVAEYLVSEGRVVPDGMTLNSAFGEVEFDEKLFAESNIGKNENDVKNYENIIRELDRWYSNFTAEDNGILAMTSPRLRAKAIAEAYK